MSATGENKIDEIVETKRWTGEKKLLAIPKYNKAR